ncbi:RNA polymerase sigma factor [Alicyclobacillus sp. SO9]|uniref:RNA polymerase sigma factor n=1 Tax=Alicyclobacillus sp. SO9 TaxID=2665646 RepID=UPI001E5057B0|nr:hypothetical protein [Alicyclobacillus sp. SO9]
MSKRKINELTVREWYADYREMIYTYLVYLTLSTEVEEIVSQVIIESAKMSTLKRTSRLHPHVLVLSTARASVKRKHRKDSEQGVLTSLNTETNTSAEALKWIASVLALPEKEREVFVLREVLGLDSRQTSQIVKYTSIKVEDRLMHACAALQDELNNEYTKQLLRKLDSDPDSLYESLLPPHIRNSLLFKTLTQAPNPDAITVMYRKWQQSRTRRKLLVTSSSAVALIAVAGFAAWAYKPWVYLLRPVNPSAKTTVLRRQYVKGVGFVPRLPTVLPKGYHLLETTLQAGNRPDLSNEKSYTAFYWTGTKRPPSTLEIIESQNSNQIQFSSDSNPNSHSDRMTINSVKVQLNLNQQTNFATAQFHVHGTYYTLINQESQSPNHTATKQQLALKNSQRKQEIIDVVRSMIVHPKVLTQPVGYTFDNLHSLQELRTRLNFTPVLPQQMPHLNATGTTQFNGVIATHKNQKYGSFNVTYRSSNQMYTVNISESKGNVTNALGNPMAQAPHPSPNEKAAIIAGQKVYVQNQMLFWKSKQTGVSFQITLQRTQSSLQQSKVDLKPIAKQLIRKEQSLPGGAK